MMGSRMGSRSRAIKRDLALWLAQDHLRFTEVIRRYVPAPTVSSSEGIVKLTVLSIKYLQIEGLTRLHMTIERDVS